MPQSVDFPVLLDGLPPAVLPCVDGVGIAGWNLVSCGGGWCVEVGYVGVVRCKHICLHPLLHNLVAVGDVDDGVLCAVKYDGWDDTRVTAHGFVGRQSLLERVGSSPF